MKRLIFLMFIFAGCEGEEKDHPGADSGTPLDFSVPEAGEDLVASDMFAIGELIPGNWITIEGGSFTMGSSPISSVCREADETSHEVTLSRSFSMAEKEVTQQQFRSLMGYNPSYHVDCGEQCPVEWVTWHEAAAYCNHVSRAQEKPLCYSCTGSGSEIRCDLSVPDIHGCQGYRLPTEAEWEYAAGCGATTDFYNGDIPNKYACMGRVEAAEAISWYKANSLGAVHPVGLKTANPWKLHDMNGNVYEWVNDWYVEDLGSGSQTDPAGPQIGTERVLRGGSWYHNAEHARTAARERFSPIKPFTFVGFRCAITL